MEQMFGPREGQQKIDFTKICIAFSFAYIMTWVPYGVVSTVYTFLPSYWTFCAYQWTKLLAFACFVIIPIVYMIMDKRVLEFVRRFLNCSCAVENKQTRAVPRGRAQAKVDTTDKKTKATAERCKDEETIQEQPQGTENKTESGNQQQIICCSNMAVDDIENYFWNSQGNKQQLKYTGRTKNRSWNKRRHKIIDVQMDSNFSKKV